MIKKIIKGLGNFFREETVEEVYQKTLKERRDSEDEDKVCLLGFYGHPERSNDIIERLRQFGARDSDGWINLEKDSANPEKIIYIIFAGNKSTFLIHSLNKKNFLENNKPGDHAIFKIDRFDSLYDIKVGDIVRVWPEKFEEKVMGFKFNPETKKINFRLSSGKVKDYYSLTKIKNSMEKKEFNLENFVKIESNGTGHLISINVPEGYEISSIDTNTGQIEVKKKSLAKLPKTYEECCNILNMPKDESYIDIDVPLDYNKLLTSFTQLLICRNAYWKIAGEEMGLGKPWKPDWGNLEEHKYVICRLYTGIVKEITDGWPRILAFPTEEMRDAFYENFKDSIHHFLSLVG